MELSKDEIFQLRNVELELLKEFIRICDVLKLPYFVVEGTLLGAVRHKGFIPWDDDIDVGMIRKDYEIFLKEAPSVLKSEYFLQTDQSDPGYLQIFAKLRKNNTAFVETTVKDLDMHHGIYIDIFPFDYYPDGKMNQLVYSFKNMMYRYRVRYSYSIEEDKKVSLKSLVRSCIYLASRMFASNPKEAVKKQIEMQKRIKPSSALINSGSPWKTREKAPLSVFKEWEPMEFEGITVSGLKDFDTYLTNTYGDYRTLPPLEQRIPHHYISYISFDKSYQRIDKNE